MNSIGEILIEVSARHIHLSQKELEDLFGDGYELKKARDLSQPGLFAAEETVTIRHNDKTISSVRVIGPCRAQTQLELSLTDAFNLGIESSVRCSGDLKNTPGIVVIGPKGEVELEEGVIASQRHIHISDKQAKELGLKDREQVQVQTEGCRALIFKNVLIRVSPDFSLAMHIDTDEANAAGIAKQGKGIILKEK